MSLIEDVTDQEVYNYSKIIRPTSMRSTYWKFFGFPADDSGTIITRRSVICSICGFALSYNKNTSNLKSHLRTKHADQANLACSSPAKKTKFIFSPSNNVTNEMKQVYTIKQQPNDIITNSDDLIEILAEGEADDYQEPCDDYQIEYLTTDDVNNFEEDTSISKISVGNTNAKSLKRKNSETLQFESLLVSMIVEDLLPTTISEGSGFISFVTALCGSRVEVLNAKLIEKEMQRLYEESYSRLSETVKADIGDRFFSIGFERWNNKEESTFITTHLNYLTEDDQLNTIVLNVIDSSYINDWKSRFFMLKMENCSAAIVDFDINEEDSLKMFLERYNIPVVPCLVTTIAKAATKCFANSKTEDVFNRSINIYNDLCRFVTDVADPPKINKSFWMTKMNFFEFILEFLMNNNSRVDIDATQLMDDIRTVIDCLTPLKLTLETVAMEHIAFASLIRPLTCQLLKSHYTLDRDGSTLKNELNAIIRMELKNTQSLASSFLMQSSFLDPRFQNLQSSEDVALIKCALKKMIHIDPDLPETLVVKKEKESPIFSNVNKPKSVGLKFFFGNKEQKPMPNKNIDRFDIEFNNYNANADASLDQLVLSWWKDSALLYPNLKKLANRFNCALLSVQKYELNVQKQITFFEKRAMCSGNAVDCLLWLHLNRSN
ncbi:E3 SUMO-protein ligase ZBED1 [Pseudolycoriella hygida]|uniref:E3 SUMO-protein ligase ZBED1 n=1 Tax=Pseudolycoriella hygida TaxID=35572 RepID=A0A9Q0N0V3_9DIPT|nr:E3 SUMO-protein ligase ZBED1 [Pseudolycoriella hygida]